MAGTKWELLLPRNNMNPKCTRNTHTHSYALRGISLVTRYIWYESTRLLQDIMGVLTCCMVLVYSVRRMQGFLLIHVMSVWNMCQSFLEFLCAQIQIYTSATTEVLELHIKAQMIFYVTVIMQNVENRFLLIYIYDLLFSIVM